MNDSYFVISLIKIKPGLFVFVVKNTRVARSAANALVI